MQETETTCVVHFCGFGTGVFEKHLFQPDPLCP